MGFTRGTPFHTTWHALTYHFSHRTYSTPCNTIRHRDPRSRVLTHIHRSSRPSVRSLFCLFPNGVQLRRRRRPVTSTAGTLCKPSSLTIPRHAHARVCVRVRAYVYACVYVYVCVCVCVCVEGWLCCCQPGLPPFLFPNLPNCVVPSSHTHTPLPFSSHAFLITSFPPPPSRTSTFVFLYHVRFLISFHLLSFSRHHPHPHTSRRRAQPAGSFQSLAPAPYIYLSVMASG